MCVERQYFLLHLILEGRLSPREFYFWKDVVNYVDWVASFEQGQSEFVYIVVESV